VLTGGHMTGEHKAFTVTAEA